jgi:hypothetical protein
MTWTEPLTADARDTDAYNFIATVTDAAGVKCAAVPCAVNRAAGCGMFGAMEIIDQDGAPRQRIRAMVLLVRTALQYAGSIGVRRVETELPDDRLLDFAARLTGREPERRGVRLYFAGDLADIRSRTLEETNGDGDFRN